MDDIGWTEWTACTGITGRLRLERVGDIAGMRTPAMPFFVFAWVAPVTWSRMSLPVHLASLWAETLCAIFRTIHTGQTLGDDNRDQVFRGPAIPRWAALCIIRLPSRVEFATSASRVASASALAMSDRKCKFSPLSHFSLSQFSRARRDYCSSPRYRSLDTIRVGTVLTALSSGIFGIP